MITKEIFLAAVGREPEDDDLERCNCQDAGKPGHNYCGWNKEKNQPVFFDSIFDQMKLKSGYYRVDLEAK